MDDEEYPIRKKPFQKMEKVLKIWHAILATIVLIISVSTMFFNLANKVETQKLEIEYLKNSDKDKALMIKDLNIQISSSVKEINNKLTDIQITLNNKENRK